MLTRIKRIVNIERILMARKRVLLKYRISLNKIEEFSIHACKREIM